MNIYDITGNFLKLQQMLESGEIDEETFKDTLESIDMDLEEKAENYAKIIKNLTKDTEGIKAEETRLKEKRQAIESNIDRLKKDLESAMIITGKTKFKTDLFSFGIQKNTPSVQIENEADFIQWAAIKREDLLKYKDPEINKKAIIEELKQGKEIIGAKIAQSESLRIR